MHDRQVQPAQRLQAAVGAHPAPSACGSYRGEHEQDGDGDQARKPRRRLPIEEAFDFAALYATCDSHDGGHRPDQQ